MFFEGWSGATSANVGRYSEFQVVVHIVREPVCFLQPARRYDCHGFVVTAVIM